MNTYFVEEGCKGSNDHQRIDDDRYRLDGRYRLNPDLAEPILTYLNAMPKEAAAAHFVRELVLALSALSDEEIDRAITEDATYANPKVGNDNVIDFGEWLSANYSAAAAEKETSAPTNGVRLRPTPAVRMKPHLGDLYSCLIIVFRAQYDN